MTIIDMFGLLEHSLDGREVDDKNDLDSAAKSAYMWPDLLNKGVLMFWIRKYLSLKSFLVVEPFIPKLDEDSKVDCARGLHLSRPTQPNIPKLQHRLVLHSSPTIR